MRLKERLHRAAFDRRPKSPIRNGRFSEAIGIHEFDRVDAESWA